MRADICSGVPAGDQDLEHARSKPVKHILVAESEEPVADTGQDSFPLCVVFHLRFVYGAICLDYECGCMTVEVGDKAPDQHLPSKVQVL